MGSLQTWHAIIRWQELVECAESMHAAQFAHLRWRSLVQMEAAPLQTRAW